MVERAVDSGGNGLFAGCCGLFGLDLLLEFIEYLLWSGEANTQQCANGERLPRTCRTGSSSGATNPILKLLTSGTSKRGTPMGNPPLTMTNCCGQKCLVSFQK
jgi:hypothetical protein